MTTDDAHRALVAALRQREADALLRDMRIAARAGATAEDISEIVLDEISNVDRAGEIARAIAADVLSKPVHLPPGRR
jgi:hypothetical protein